MLDIVQQPTAGERTAVLQQYVTSIWLRWMTHYTAIIAAWYDQFVGER
ncbi:MAG: hypothetical protein KC413_22360 [Anaerolineales bacterium]|nr:hypothetical protein [Anaerolineales bacterium]